MALQPRHKEPRPSGGVYLYTTKYKVEFPVPYENSDFYSLDCFGPSPRNDATPRRLRSPSAPSRRHIPSMR